MIKRLRERALARLQLFEQQLFTGLSPQGDPLDSAMRTSLRRSISQIKRRMGEYARRAPEEAALLQALAASRARKEAEVARCGGLSEDFMVAERARTMDEACKIIQGE